MNLSPASRELLASFGFRSSQKAEVWDAWLESPDGVERCALRAQAEGKRNGNTGAGLLLTMIRRGDHRVEFDPNARRITGWRFVRHPHGTSGNYVPDPRGTDPLPPGYGLDDPRKVFGDRLDERGLRHSLSERGEES